MKRQIISYCALAVLLTVLLAVVWPTCLHAQGIRQSVGLVKESKDNTTEASEAMRGRMVPSVSFPGNDTLYCTQTKKQHGWLMPMDTISQEYASHRSLSFRFTHRYPSGHWGKMEVVDAYGNLRTGGMTPYILKVDQADSDTEANTNWVEKLKTCSTYEFIADPSGKNVVQERVYDKEGNIVYTYSRVPIGEKDGKRRYIGSYKDCFGLPAEMRKDSLYTYGTLVRLTEDQWGNDSIVEYIDAKGKPKLNSDSVAMEVFICDRYGRMLKQQSRDEHGDLTIDNWGNCGNEYVWNDDHEIISATHMDDNWHPMRMPDKRKMENTFGVIKVVYAYDSWKRQVEEAYYTADDVPDCNLYGIHRITCEYDDRGRALRTARFDFDGNLKEGSFGIAVEEYTYDNDGRNIGIVFLDKDRKPCSKPGYLSKVLYAYNDEGNVVQEKRYVVYSGKETLDYEYKEGKNYKYIRWSDNVMRIDSLDAEGRLVKRVYTDWNGNLSDESVGYAINEITYVPRPYGNDITDCYYDKNGELCDSGDGWAVKEMKSDTIFRKNNVRLYDKEKRLISTYAKIYDKNGWEISLDDTNAFGISCRAGGLSSVRYYRALAGYSINGNTFTTLIGRDEFGEPDYISSSWGIYYYVKISAKGNDLNMDENSRVIIDQEKFKNECPKLMTIEVTDSMAYKLGLRDNDVVLLDGDYAVDVFALDSVLVSCNDFVRNWTVHSVLDGNRNRSMVVFRVDPETLEYGLVKIDHLKGSPSELGYLAHIRYLTRKQLKRIQACIMDNMESDNPLVRKSDLAGMDYSGDNMMIMAFTDMYRNVRHCPYAREVTDPSILLGACMNEGNMTWKFGENSSDSFKKILATRQMRASAYPVQHFYLTRNGKDIIDLKNDEKNVRTNWMVVYVSDEVYRKLVSLSRKAGSMLADEMTDVPRLDKKDLVDNWTLRVVGSGHVPRAQMSLLKDGTMKGYIERYDSIEYNGGHALFRIRQDLDGQWTAWGRIIEMEYPEKDSLSVVCVDYTGAGPELKAQILEQMNQSVKDDPVGCASRMGITSLGRFVYVKSLSKDSLVIEDGSGEKLVFRRSKDELEK